MVEAEDTVQEMNLTFSEELAAWRQPHIESGAMVQLPEDLYRPLLVGPLHEFSRQWLAGRGTTTMAEAQSVLADAIWQAMKGSERTPA